MRRAMRRSLLFLPAGLLPALLLAQGQPTPVGSGAEQPQVQVRYEPLDPNEMAALPIKTCSIVSKAVPRPYTFKMPVKVKISLFDEKELKKQATFFEGVLKEPKKLDPGSYVIEVEGQKDLIHVIYGIQPAMQTYLIYQLPENQLMGPFFLPGHARMPIRRYHARGTGFEFDIECRENEKAVFEVPVYEKLPPFLAPSTGIAW